MLTSSFTSSLRLASILTAKPSILLWKIGHVHHRMNFVRIIEWILLKLSNEYCLNFFINVGENRMHITANLSNFATSLLNVLNKIKYIWILLSLCGNYQTHIRDIEYWHISATIYLIMPRPCLGRQGWCNLNVQVASFAE